MPDKIYENDIEKAIITIFTRDLGYRHHNYQTPLNQSEDNSGRKSKEDVVFKEILKQKARAFTPATIPQSAVDKALEKLTDHRRTMSPIRANKEVYALIRDGITVDFDNAEGKKQMGRVRVIDFNNWEENDFLVASQLKIKGDYQGRIPDLLLYVNGLPLVYIELKNITVPVNYAFEKNLKDCLKDIPQLFVFNAFCILSSAIETKVGAFSAGLQNFYNWLRVTDEKEKIDRKAIAKEKTSIERTLHALCQKEKLLDFIENFILFKEDLGIKIVAQNHQFIGVNKAVESFKNRHNKEGKLGVFWHTQGSGKSISMVFFTHKIFRKITGNFTFVVITDRLSLDGQIYRNYLDTGIVTENSEVRPDNGNQLREYLSRNKRVVFSTIQKFKNPDKGKKEYPILNDRDDIIVIVDEAHRTQYEELAANMRRGLPNAQYIAFTGTPLMAKDKTREWFGGYVSQYNFVQAIDDGATLPLFYKKRVP
ncbi:MAG: type I restriction endonuclease subunit R, partial [bacterium]|nr:type I restriction endonuclease subunit R [bacterium]